MRYPPRSIGHQLEYLRDFFPWQADNFIFHGGKITRYNDGPTILKVEWGKFDKPLFFLTKESKMQDSQESLDRFVDEKTDQIYESLDFRLDDSEKKMLKKFASFTEPYVISVVSLDFSYAYPQVKKLIDVHCLSKPEEEYQGFGPALFREGTYPLLKMKIEISPFGKGYIDYLERLDKNQEAL